MPSHFLLFFFKKEKTCKEKTCYNKNVVCPDFIHYAGPAFIYIYLLCTHMQSTCMHRFGRGFYWALQEPRPYISHRSTARIVCVCALAYTHRKVDEFGHALTWCQIGYFNRTKYG